MIKSEKERRDEAEQESQEFADYIAQQEEEPRKRKPPTIEESRSVLETQPFNLDLNVEESAEGGDSDGGGIGPPPPEEDTGACCLEDGTCDDEHGELYCEDSGGDYQGDGTDCGEVTCPDPTGACCDGEDCSITTLVECSGEYQGDGSECDPNPCSTLPECECGGFGAFDGSGRVFLHKTSIVTHSWSNEGSGCGSQNSEYSYQSDQQFEGCDVTSVCFGSGSCDATPCIDGDPCSCTATILGTSCDLTTSCSDCDPTCNNCNACVATLDFFFYGGCVPGGFTWSTCTTTVLGPDSAHIHKSRSSDNGIEDTYIYLTDECIPV